MSGSKTAYGHRRDRKTLTAYHEAAHAVVAHYVGLKVGEISIRRTFPSEGRVRWRPPPNMERTRWIIAEIMASFAGMIAELKLSPQINIANDRKQRGSTRDFQRIDAVLHQIKPEFRRWARKELYKHACERVRMHSGEIHLLADILMTRYPNRKMQRREFLLMLGVQDHGEIQLDLFPDDRLGRP